MVVLFRLEDWTLVTELPERIKEKAEIYFLKSGNRIYSPEGTLNFENNLVIQVCVRVRGGKGGFGSRLKAEGQRLSNPKRSGNYAECKDLEGRRLKDVRDAQMIQEYLEREPELKAKVHAERVSYYQDVLSGAIVKPKYTKREERTVQNVEAAVADLNLIKETKQLQVMVFFSCFRGRRKSSSGAAIPHFQITQIPEDGVNALLQRKRKVEMEEKVELPAVVPIASPSTSNWKPYHNATVAVSSVLKRNNPLPPEHEFYTTTLNLPSQELLKDEPEQKKLIRSPTPDALTLFADEPSSNTPIGPSSSVESLNTTSSRVESLDEMIDLESLPPVPPVDDIELLELAEPAVSIEQVKQILNDPVLNQELDNLQNSNNSDKDFDGGDQQPHAIANMDDEVNEDLEIALEGLFLEAPELVSLMNSTIDSGDMTPNTLALRLPMRCKTRVTEMATWFEKQMNHPEHNETFQHQEQQEQSLI